MNTASAALALDFTAPALLAACKVRDILNRAEGLDRQSLIAITTQSYGSAAADGRWTMRDAYDALESGEVLHLIDAALSSDPSAALSQLNALLISLPTHSVRSEAQIALQQFSTPAPIAYLANLALRLSAADLVLEPSAGTGLLAVFAHRAGARLVLNEIDPARADLLRNAFPGAPVTLHDAELIHDLLPVAIRPTAVLINPPFARSIGRAADPIASMRHLRAALLRLAPGGRCAVIVPNRIDTSSAEWKTATEGCALTLHLVLPANAYAKHGTAQAVKLMLLRKGGTGHIPAIACATLHDALAQISAVTEPALRATAPLIPALGLRC